MAGLDLGFDDDLIGGLLPKRRRRNDSQPLDDEQQNSVLGDIGEATLSGVGAVGNFLDIPGSIARDALATVTTGKWHNPVDQLLSPFSDKNRVTGRDLNRKWGLAGKKDTWANWFGGFATELATDPLTYLGPGALTKTAKLLQGAGMLDDVGRAAAKGVGRRVARMTPGIADDILRLGDTAAQAARRSEVADVAAKMFPGENLDDLLKQPLQEGLANFGLPIDGLNFNIGTGKLGKRIAGALDKVGMIAKASPVGRAASMLFDPEVMGTLDPVSQELARNTYGQMRDAERVYKSAHLKALDSYGMTKEAFHDAFRGDISAGLPHGSSMAEAMTENVRDRITRLAAELGDTDKAFDAFKQFKLDPNKLTPQVRQQILDTGKEMIESAAKLREARIEMGAAGGWLGDLPSGGSVPGAGASPIAHMARYAKEWRDWADVSKVRQHIVKTGSDLGREETTRHLPTEVANQILMDTLARPHPGHDPVDYIKQTYGQFLGHGNQEMVDPTTGAAYAVNRWAPGQPHGGPAAVDAHAKALSKYAEEHAMRAMYTNSTVSDYAKQMKDGFRSQAALNAMHEMIARELPANLADTHGKGIKLGSAYGAAGLDPNKSLNYMADVLTRKYGIQPQLKAAYRSALENAEIPEDMMRAIVAMKKVNTEPEWLGLIGKNIDAFNNWFKSWVYLPFPSSSVRNLTSGTFVNATTGYVDGPRDMAGLLRQTKNAAAAFRKGDKDIAREFFTQGVFDPHNAHDIELAMSHGMMPGNPADVRGAYRDLANKKAIENTQRGKSPALSTTQKAGVAANTVLETGARANSLVEWTNRGGMYLYLTREKGWSPRAAAEKVKEIHFDYGSSGRTDFERQVVSRLVPFYRFQRGMAPLFLKTLARHPGGALAQTVRAERLAGGNDPSRPDYISSTLAVPNPLRPDKPDGSKSYITGFGLPFEPVTQYAEGLPNPRSAVRKVFSQTTPLLKAPIELATGQSLFQTGPGGVGRNIDDLDPTIGRTIKSVGYYAGLNGPSDKPANVGKATEFVVANSPLSRIATTARMLADPRKNVAEKAVGFTTGARVSDVSPAAQDAVLRQRLAQQMKNAGAAEFSKIYFRKDDKAKLPPDEAERTRRMEGLMNELARRAKERKKAKAGAGK